MKEWRRKEKKALACFQQHTCHTRRKWKGSGDGKHELTIPLFISSMDRSLRAGVPLKIKYAHLRILIRQFPDKSETIIRG